VTAAPRGSALVELADGLADDIRHANLIQLAAFGLRETGSDQEDAQVLIGGLRRLATQLEERARQVDRLLEQERRSGKPRRPRKRGKPALRVVT
jgi:hypothetical protein